MSDQENFNEKPTPVDPSAAPEPLQQTQAQSVRELRDVPVEAVPTEELPDIAKDVKEDEPEGAKDARRQTEAILNKPIEAIEDAVNEADAEDTPRTRADTLPSHVGNTTTVHVPFLKREYVLPYSVYTVVFGTLAVITIVEVASAEIFADGWLLTLWLVALSIAKAVMVMWFYMHLKDDSRIFAFSIILPIIIAAVATLFLASVSPFGY